MERQIDLIYAPQLMSAERSPATPNGYARGRPGDQTPRRATRHPRPPGHAEHWVTWRRRHQARARWYHKRTRLARATTIVQVR
jgi:hypothetical protein